MKYILLSLLGLSCGFIYAQRSVSLEGNKMTLEQAQVEKSRVEALTEEWNLLKQRLKAINEEKDSQKKMALLKTEAQTLVDKGQKLVDKIRDMNITPESKQKLITMISESDELTLIKSEWPLIRENLKKISEEKDPKKKLALIQQEGKRLAEKGKLLTTKAKERITQLSDFFKKKK